MLIVLVIMLIVLVIMLIVLVIVIVLVIMVVVLVIVLVTGRGVLVIALVVLVILLGGGGGGGLGVVDGELGQRHLLVLVRVELLEQLLRLLDHLRLVVLRVLLLEVLHQLGQRDNAVAADVQPPEVLPRVLLAAAVGVARRLRRLVEVPRQPLSEGNEAVAVLVEVLKLGFRAFTKLRELRIGRLRFVFAFILEVPLEEHEFV
mmetsp:Transcript_9341/g.26797  ORF Transcript_9341/g.26797 Transcript_9341/m.26797 type:complete len:203 (-) Transcript_9341:395-1003(-)